jgi:hypothetical protein
MSKQDERPVVVIDTDEPQVRQDMKLGLVKVKKSDLVKAPATVIELFETLKKGLEEAKS